MSWLRLEHLQATGDGELVRDGSGTPTEFRVPCQTKGAPVLPDKVCCTAPMPLKNGTKTIRYRDRRIEPVPTWLEVRRQRFKCKSCGATIYEVLPDLWRRRFAAVARPVGLESGVFGGEFMPLFAVGLTLFCAVPSCVAQRTDHLHIKMMSRCVSAVMIVLVSPLTLPPLMAAVDAWKLVWMGPPSGPYLDIDPLPRLFAIAIPRRLWCRSWPPGQWVHPERHQFAPGLETE